MLDACETEEKKDEESATLVRSSPFHVNALQNTRFVYPITVPSVLDNILADCWLYHTGTGAKSGMLIPNAGYAFGWRSSTRGSLELRAQLHILYGVNFWIWAPLDLARTRRGNQQ